MRPVHFIAVFAALVGVAAVGLALWGFQKLDFLEWAMTMGRAFDNSEYRNIQVGEWRARFLALMTVFLLFGVAALVSAYGLFKAKRWAQYLWLALIVVNIIAAVRELATDVSAWIWIAVSVTILVLSALVFRVGGRLSAAP